MKKLNLILMSIIILALMIAIACAGGVMTPARNISSTTTNLPGATIPPTKKGSQPQAGTAYYVRTDGGSPDQCNGLSDAPYPGSGTGQPCAWDHPFRALPPGGTPRIHGGDTLMIGSGSYKMGYGAPGTDACDEAMSYDCQMPPVPGGPNPDQPTRIVGQDWDSGCAAPPELWGSGRPWQLIDLSNADNIVIACLEITDHSDCVESHSGGLACNRDNPPYGDWAVTGLYAQDSANVLLRDLNIHGLADRGVLAGRLKDWTVENVRIVGNGWAGWDGDIEGDDSNSGTMTFRRWDVEWNGCGETYPGQEPVGCWAQTAGGYGDGVGTGATGGNWTIEDSSFLHNTSDGLDLLYHSEGGTVTLERVHAEGNAGNQVKVTGLTSLKDSLLVGNCAFFENQPFTYNVDPCRAVGNTLEVAFTGSEQVSIINSTFYGQGDGLIGGGPREGYTCSGTERIEARNNIFLGATDFFDPGDISFLFYQEGCPGLKLDSDYDLSYSVKNIICNGDEAYVSSGSHDLCQDPLLNGPLSGRAFGMIPLAGSPAIDSGSDAICPSLDVLNVPRPADGNGDGEAHCDMGAYEVNTANR